MSKEQEQDRVLRQLTVLNHRYSVEFCRRLPNTKGRAIGPYRCGRDGYEDRFQGAERHRAVV